MQLIAIFLANQAKAQTKFGACDTQTESNGCDPNLKCVSGTVVGDTVVWAEEDMDVSKFCMPVADNNKCSVLITSNAYDPTQAGDNVICQVGTTCYFEANALLDGDSDYEGVCVLEAAAVCDTTANVTGAPCPEGSNCLTANVSADDAAIVTFADGSLAASDAACITAGTDGCKVTFLLGAVDINTVKESCKEGAGDCAMAAVANGEQEGSCASANPSGDLLAAYQLCTVGTNECNTESQCVTGAIVDKVVTWTAATDSDVSYCIPTSKDPLVCNVQIADSAYAIDGQADAGTMCAADSLVCTLDDEAKEGDDNPGTCKASPSSSNASIAMATTLVIALTGFLF